MHKGSFAVVLKGDKVLLVKPPDWVPEYSGHWNFPGGSVETGESLEEGAAREVFEETNITCSIGELIDSAHNDKYDISISIFKAKYISGEVKIQETEIKEAEWFSIKEALELPLAFEIKKTLVKLSA